MGRRFWERYRVGSNVNKVSDFIILIEFYVHAMLAYVEVVQMTVKYGIFELFLFKINYFFQRIRHPDSDRLNPK